MLGLTVNGQSVSLDAGSASYAAIDTGTTLVGRPADSISALYAHIPGSEALTGDDAGYYTYRELPPHPAVPPAVSLDKACRALFYS